MIKLALILIIAQLSACAVVTTQNEGKSTSKLYFGLFRLKIEDKKGSIQAQDMKNFGLSVSPNNFELGWVNNSSITILDKSKCAAIFWVAGEQAADKLLDYFKDKNIDIETICILNGAK